MADNLQIVFEKDPDYKLIPVSGCWGGVTPQRYVQMDMYFEYRNSPEKIVFENVKTILNIEQGRTEGSQDIIRKAYCGCVMSPEIAYSISVWLKQKAKEAGYSPPEEE